MYCNLLLKKINKLQKNKKTKIADHFRGTQRFVSGSICLGDLKSPEIFGFDRSES